MDIRELTVWYRRALYISFGKIRDNAISARAAQATSASDWQSFISQIEVEQRRALTADQEEIYRSNWSELMGREEE